ncbi:MAG: tetratricopeptide repeat protein [Planctomycetaceae bacterium]
MSSSQSFEKLTQLAFDAMAQKDWGKAIVLYRSLLAAHPGDEFAFNNYGFSLWQVGRIGEAIPQFRRALQFNPKCELALSNLVQCLELSHRRSETIPFRRRLLTLDESSRDHRLQLAKALLDSGRISEALRHYQILLERFANDAEIVSDYLLTLNYSDAWNEDEVASEHMRWGRNTVCQQAVSPAVNEVRDRKLRLGYLSADFVQHPVGKLLEQILAEHDHEIFDVFLYHDQSYSDEWTNRIRQYGQFREVHTLSGRELRQMLLADQLDILIETGGYTGGRHRFDVLTPRVAPTQIAFLGYPTTTGQPCIDFRITDPLTDPPSPAETYYSEKLIRLPTLAIAHRFPEEWCLATPSPAKENGYITFGSFNNPAKLSMSALRAWGRMLGRVPNSRLVLKYGDRLEQASIQERILETLCESGALSDRVDFLQAAPTHKEHHLAIASVDIALDSFPYQGTFTTLETLAMGVPVVTLAGKAHCRRASSAMLLHLSFPDLVTESVDDYVELCISLASDVHRLAAMRKELFNRFHNSRIADPANLTRCLERALLSTLGQP